MQLRTRILLALVVAAMVAPTAAATHMRYYSQVFIEHDDQGRSDEPDFASTGVLGAPVGNCVVDLTPADAGCIPDGAVPAPLPGHSNVLAPGCTDDSGRRPSGLCGMWTIGVYHPELQDPSLATPPGLAGVEGMSGADAPGRLSASKATTIRFLDIRTVQHEFFPGTVGSHYIDVNAKLADTGVSAALKSLDPSLGGKFLAHRVGIWAWYGQWADKNGNGVIDHLGDDSCDATSMTCGGNGGVRADNEFVWVGNCFQFGGVAPPLGQKYCKPEQVNNFPVWIWPGNHHAFCGGTLPIGGDEFSCSSVGSETPGRQPICFVDALSGDLTTGTGQTPFFCDQDLKTFDLTDADFFGDPVFGKQDEVWPDHDSGMDDRSGDIDPGTRHWIYGFGWASHFYDQGTLVTTYIMGGPTLQAANPEDRNRVPYDLTKFQSFDVDVFRSVNPAVEELLQNNLKPTARSNWVTVRDNFIPIQTFIDATRNQRALDTSATTGPVDDAVVNPGWAREPNTAFDRFPGARFNAFAPADPNVPDADERRNGWLNDYAGHRDQWHVFADVQGFRLVHTNLVWRNPLNGQCLPGNCVAGGGTFTDNQYLNSGANANRQRTLEPGMYLFAGFVGAWRDTAQPIHEEVIDLAASIAAGSLQAKTYDYVVPHDGWVGNIVNSTGTWKYRGYPGPNEPGAPTCTIAGVSASRYFGECNPYWDAIVAEADIYAGPFQDPGVDQEDPQSGDGGEFEGIFPALPSTSQHLIKVYPAGAGGSCDSVGTWTAPVMVWRNFIQWTIGNTGGIEDYTGRSGASAVIAMQSGTGSGLGAQDYILLPQGNVGQTVCTEFAETVVVDLPARGIGLREAVREVDVYAPWA